MYISMFVDLSLCNFKLVYIGTSDNDYNHTF